MRNDHYALEEDKFYIKRILKFFEHDFNPPQEENKTDVEFLEKYRVKELFLKIINKFDPGLHIPHSKKLLFQSIDKWNENNSKQKFDLKELVDKYYLIQSEHFAILNPYLLRGTYNPNPIYKFYESLDKKAIIYFPFFYGHHIEESIKEMSYSNFNMKDLINDEEDLFDAIFHNYKGMGKQFNEALATYLLNISYSEWTKNIDKYFYLLVALNFMELNLDTIFNSIGLYKKDQLKRFAFQVLKTKNEILKIENVNFLQRLLYVPYEIEGTDIYNPPEGSSLVPYSDEYKEENNLFKRIDSVEQWIFNSYENRNLFRDLFKDVDFILWYLGSEFSLSDWEEIFKSCNSDFYKLEFISTLSLKKDKWVESNDLNFLPFIISQLFNSSANINLTKEREINVNELKFKILRFFIDSIYEGKEIDLSLLLDLYLYLPSSPGVIQYDYQYEVKKMLRNYVIDIFSENKSDKVFDLVLKKVSEQIDRPFDFSPFDIFNGYWEYSNKLTPIIINHYYKILEQETLIGHYYDIGGKENFFKAISFFTNSELTTFLNKYNFISLFNNIESTNNIYNEGEKLRFHLGILTEYSLKYDKHRNEIIDYVINTYKSIIKLKSEIIEPLEWDDIVSDTFLFNTNFSERQLLSIIIIDLLAFKNDDYITDYFDEIKDYLSFTELSFYQKKFPENKSLKHFDPTSLFPKDLKGTGLGRAKVEAQLLLKYDLPDKAIKYVEYIESLGMEYLSNYIKEIKFRACLVLKDFDNAEKTLGTIPGVRDNLIGLFYYFKKDYPNSVKSFEKYKRFYRFLTIEDIINFSLALIMNNQPSDAIKLLEGIKEENPKEYFIFYNLGIAYKEIDKYQSLVYLNYARKIKPELTDTKLEFYNSLNNLIPDFAKVLEEFSSEPDFINNIMTEFNAQSSDVLKITSQLTIDDSEKRIVTEIYSALEERAIDPIRLESTKETELSNDIKGLLKASLKNENIIIEREAPGGRSQKEIGEIDLFLYRNPDTILSVGENKEWSPDKFKRQIMQLLGYTRDNRGFGFTIIFNKTVRIETVLKEREKILKEFFVEIDGEKYFHIIKPIYDASNFINNIKDVLLTVHKNGDSSLRIYHFIITAYDKEKSGAAKKARNKKSQA